MSARKRYNELKQEATEGRGFERMHAKRRPDRPGQVPIKDRAGKTRRLDFYDAAKGEIISVKSLAAANGQIAMTNEFTMLKHFQEFALKYPSGGQIASGPLKGQTLRGTYVLEVPPQTYRIPDRILELARQSRVTIRDYVGNVY
jgi:filamentous hemagglutinin